MEYLIVVDMQNDFVDGALGTPEAASILPHVVDRIKNFKGIVLFTRDTHHEDYLQTLEGEALPVAHCIQGSAGWQLCGQVAELVSEPPIDKPTFGSVELGNMLAAANQASPIERITLIGLCTDICVISNALLLKAFLPQTPILVDASCCAGVTPESHRRALDAMRACQIEIINA